MFQEYETRAVVYQGSLPKGTDLIKGLTAVLNEKNITCGSI